MADGSSAHHGAWRRACNGGSCVEVAICDGRVKVRDSKRGCDGPVLDFSDEEWRTFVEAVKSNRFDVPE
ncbi:DUF397 domain-containing protein [Nonomuraea sp. MTCD27]|uniref:DUF397 domain-containing protein n=1 Tax=Nonomuraea sp. MTCD27 TaxID=1676747 RepID=UPI0035C191AE